MNWQQLQSEAHLGWLAGDALPSAQQALIEVREGGDAWQAGCYVRRRNQQWFVLDDHPSL